MKKLIALVLALILCLSLVACGPDRQPAIDAFNKAKDSFNEVANAINADIESYDPEVIETMNGIADAMEQNRKRLESDEDLTQEQLDEIMKWCEEVDDWVKMAKADLEIE